MQGREGRFGASSRACGLVDIRCGHCSRKLGAGHFTALVIKCPRCRAINHLSAERATPPERHRAPVATTGAPDGESGSDD